MLASDSGEMDSALFLLSRGVSLGLEKRDTADTQVRSHVSTSLRPGPNTFQQKFNDKHKKIPKCLRAPPHMRRPPEDSDITNQSSISSTVILCNYSR